MSKKSNSSRLKPANKLIQDESSIVSETPYKEKLKSSGSVVSKEIENVNTSSKTGQAESTPEPLSINMSIASSVEEEKVSADASLSGVQDQIVSGDAAPSDANQPSLLNEMITNGEKSPKYFDDLDKSDG
jgi:hypothetical protein